MGKLVSFVQFQREELYDLKSSKNENRFYCFSGTKNLA